jgi:hypothetical protein
MSVLPRAISRDDTAQRNFHVLPVLIDKPGNPEPAVALALTACDFKHREPAGSHRAKVESGDAGKLFPR